MLTEKDRKRYLRHILLEEIGGEGQLKLKKARVLVIGAGGLGCPVLQYLAAAGVGKIGIVDGDLVDLANLQRQVLYSEKDVGQPKVRAARNRLLAMNSSIDVVAHQKMLTSENALKLFAGYDIIVEGSDSFTTKYLANDAAVLSGKPLVLGSIFKFNGQVSVFNYQGGPTYRCLYPEPGSPEEMPACSDVGVLGILPGIIGNLQANEVLKMILEIGKVLSGKLLLFDALEMGIKILPFVRNHMVKIERLEEISFSCEIRSGRSLTYSEYQSASGAYTLLDVRTTEERAVFHIGGIHIPLQELQQRKEELASEKDVLIYCASGVRSAKAISVLREFFPKKTFYNLEGGIKNLS